mgnify:CR=1 FL=1
MDLLRGSGGASQGNMRSEQMEAQTSQARQRNRAETQRLRDKLDQAQGGVGQVGEANTMKAISDTLTGGFLSAKVAPAVKEYRAFHNQRVALQRAKLASDNSVEGVVGKIKAETPVTQSAPKPVRPNLMLQEDEVSPAEPVAPDGSAPVKAPTVEPQEAPKPLKVVGKAGEEAGEEITEEAAGKMAGRVMKGASALQGAGNLYQDISTGSIGGKGSNWEQKVGNIGTMVGAVADFIPGGEAVGAGIGLLSGIFSDIGDTVAGEKKKAAATAKVAAAKTALAAQVAKPVENVSLAAPTVSYGRSI